MFIVSLKGLAGSVNNFGAHNQSFVITNHSSAATTAASMADAAVNAESDGSAADSGAGAGAGTGAEAETGGGGAGAGAEAASPLEGKTLTLPLNLSTSRLPV